MNTETMERYTEWNSQNELPLNLQMELSQIKDNNALINDHFYQDLTFGTGGLRGVLGVGSNRMNIFTVAKATKGLADYINSTFQTPSCAIAYDSRIMSLEFAKVAACILADNNIEVWIYPTLMPTPMLSYAVRTLSCNAGIVITASHNPSQFNGYKVYGPDGCQITLEAANEITQYINKHNMFPFLISDFEQNILNKKVNYIEDNIFDSYIKKVNELQLSNTDIPLHVIYSPLHGAGNIPVQKIVSTIPNITLTTVKEQEEPNGKFPTCPYPNPEDPEAMRLVSEQLLQTQADLGFATDPDCDRVGVVVLDENNNIHLINGNEMGCMLLEYICQMRIANKTMPLHPVAVKTIVTSEMATAITKRYGVSLRNVLTGFKFIGEQIAELEKEQRENDFIFGFEESYGYLAGTFVRDKDAVIASRLICEMASYYKQKGLTLWEVLRDLYQNYGYYRSELLSFAFEGQQGMNDMENFLQTLRINPPKYIADLSIQSIVDYLNDDTGLPKSNVLSFQLDNNCQVLFRPSGTEPKLKIYITATGKDAITSDICKEALISVCCTLVEQR